MNEVVYRGLRKDEMEFHFNPRVAVPDYPRLAEERAKVSAAVRSNLKSWLNVPYGKSPRQVLDIFPAERTNAPVQLYIHGGYWRGGSKDDSSFIAPTFVKAGATLVLLEYDLCPDVTVTDIVRQARAGIAWVYRNITRYGGDPSRLYISGNSVGGHLVAMALAYDWEKQENLPRDIIKGAVAITGVYDLDPVFHISVNEEIRLNPESARENSPMLHPPLPHTPLIIAVGGEEPLGWKRMSMDFFQLCKERGVDGEYMDIPGAHHYSVSALLSDPKSLLARAMLTQMGL